MVSSRRSSNKAVLVQVEFSGGGRRDRLLVVEKMRLLGEESLLEDNLMLPEAPDATRYVSQRRVDDFLAGFSDEQGFYVIDRSIPTDVPEWSRVVESLRKSSLVDLRQLFSILFPTLTAGSVTEWRQAFGIPNHLERRLALAQLVEIAARKAAGLPRGLLRRLKRLAADTEPPLKAWFESIRPGVGRPAFAEDDSYFRDLSAFQNLTEGVTLSGSKISALLEDAGKASGLIEGFELRPGQSRYAAEVSTALDDGQIMLIEAATGTGKSIGYLLPLISWSRKTESRALVVTRTKSLQEQLFRSDLRKIKRLIPSAFRIAVLKGLVNYVCLLKFKFLVGQTDFSLEAPTAKRIMALLIWEEETKSGDLAETEVFAHEAAASLRQRLTLDEVSCLGPRCTYYKHCYGFRARKNAAKANLVITNYALLLADLQLEGSILGRFGCAVFDEAHRLESEAVRAFTARLPLASLARHLEQMAVRSAGIPAMDASVTSLGKVLAPAKAQEFCRKLSTDLNSTAEQIRSLLIAASRRGTEGIRFLHGDQVHQLLVEHWYHHGDDYEVLSRWLLETVTSLNSATDSGTESQLAELKRRLTRLSGYIKLLKLLGSTAEPEAVMWGDVSASGETTLTVAPANVGGLLAKRLFTEYQAVVLTSATLDSEDSFGWISRQLGLTAEHDIEPIYLKLGSPFPLSEQLLIALADYLPQPDSNRYPARLAQLLAKLRRQVQVATLVLCTSYRMIEALESSLSQQERIPGELLVQSPGKSPERLLTRFQQNDRAMLIGTESFWEGVDLPGDFLRLLILTRLPFPVPDDPLQLAKSERAAARGENPFTTVSLPAAILKYRQALGRVIRGLSDWGAVVITDSRMARKSYGSLFYAAAATEVQTQAHESTLIKTVSHWFSQRWERQ